MDDGQEYGFKVFDQRVFAMSIEGLVIPPVDTVFEGDLYLRALPNNTYYGQFNNTAWSGNVNNKGNLEMPFLVEMKEDRIDSIHVTNEWERKGVRYVYEIMKDLLTDYGPLMSLNNSVDNLQVALPFGLCNASVVVEQRSDEKIIKAKSDKRKCELDQDLIQIIGYDAEALLTDFTFIEVKIHQNLAEEEEEPFSKLEVTLNIRASDPIKDFMVAMVSNTEITYVKLIPNEMSLTLESELMIKHSRTEILDY